MNDEKLEMYDSLQNGDCFQKPKFDYRTYNRDRRSVPIVAPSDIFKPLEDEESKGHEPEAEHAEYRVTAR